MENNQLEHIRKTHVDGSVESNRDNNSLDWSSFTEFVDEFKNESDRAAVVLGAAKLDLLLYQIIQVYLIPTTSGKDELLDGNSPLSTFSAKINFAYRIGLINSEYARSLHLIRKIRNSFAHEVYGCSLKNGAHCDRVRELAKPFKCYAFYHQFKTFFFKDEDGTHIDFRATLAIMVGRLEKFFSDIETIMPNTTLPLIRPEMEKIKN